MTVGDGGRLPLTPSPFLPTTKGKGSAAPHRHHKRSPQAASRNLSFEVEAASRMQSPGENNHQDPPDAPVRSPGGTSVTQPWTFGPGRRGRHDDIDRDTDPSTPLIEVTGLEQIFHTPAGKVHAVNGVDFAIAPGEAVGLVGEGGSGKSTIARCLVRLQEPSGGTIRFQGRDVTYLSENEFRPLRSKIQMVFQDPTMSLNPRLSVRQTLAEPLKVHGVAKGGKDLEARILELMDHVNLERRLVNRQPGELSGG